KFGIDSAKVQFDTAAVAAEQHIVHLRDLEERVGALVREGQAAYQREVGRTLPYVAHDFWFDERFNTFLWKLAWAQRLTYMAMRAVEYDEQASLGLRDDILAAAHPDQLARIITRLNGEILTNQVHGKRPTEKFVVYSLRDDVLGLADQSDEASGEQ